MGLLLEGENILLFMWTTSPRSSLRILCIHSNSLLSFTPQPFSQGEGVVCCQAAYAHTCLIPYVLFQASHGKRKNES